MLKHEKASGAKINKSKSEITYYGNAKDGNKEWGFKNIQGERKALGVYIGENAEEADNKTWGDLISKIKSNLNLWKLRGLMLRGRVAVVNALTMSKVNHALSTCVLPLWAYKEINSVIDSFVWKGKANIVAHKTLMGSKKQGGLAIVDLKTKQEALRIKMVGKFLAQEVEPAWKGFFQEHLESFGFRNKINLIQKQKDNCYEHLPAFFKEVLDAWYQVLPLTVPECGTRGCVLQLPFLSSPYFRHKGRVLVNGALGRAGITQIKHIVNTKGEIDSEKVIGKLKEEKIKFRKDVINKFLEKIKGCIKKEWWDVLKCNNDVVRDDEVEILLCLGAKTSNIKHTKTRNIYHALLHTRLQPPTAEKKWTLTFPNYDTSNIWKNLDIANTPHTVFNMDFKIRHRRVFTSIILHQICKEKYKRCCYVCKTEDEDLEHLFLKCHELRSFHEKLWSFIQDKCGIQIPEAEKEWTLFFGLNGGKNKLTNIVNMVLAFARQAIFNRRNYALYEEKMKNVWTLFTCTLKAHLKLLFMVEGREFAQFYTENTGLCTVDGKEVFFEF